MAERAIIETGIGLPGLFPGLQIPEDGKLTPVQIAYLVSGLQLVTETVNGNLSFGDGSRASRGGNFNAQWVTQFFSKASAEFEIPHGLDRVPTDVWVGIPDAPATVYTAKRKSWTKKTIWLASTDIATVSILIF